MSIEENKAIVGTAEAQTPRSSCSTSSRHDDNRQAWREPHRGRAGCRPRPKLAEPRAAADTDLCVGWHWLPYTSQEAAAEYNPDVALINFYDRAANLGMHQDNDERSDAPIVSLSIGDDCIFRFGNTNNRSRPADSTSRSASLACPSHLTSRKAASVFTV
jgi:alkylated DNA repair dioxygenase AlkB